MKLLLLAPLLFLHFTTVAQSLNTEQKKMFDLLEKKSTINNISKDDTTIVIEIIKKFKSITKKTYLINNEKVFLLQPNAAPTPIVDSIQINDILAYLDINQNQPLEIDNIIHFPIGCVRTKRQWKKDDKLIQRFFKIKKEEIKSTYEFVSILEQRNIRKYILYPNLDLEPELDNIIWSF